ncbi:SpoIIE family protein phosphatase [Streptomyces sp. NPDC048291]|uniref:ATP-binding SpoIIE family protein phosphatase n=1 Tax=Streptomyces sp. NPDC048291 TaxID=3365530 RepID=UPI0037124282
MGTDTHAYLSEVARGLAPRADQLVDVVLQHLRAEFPEVWKYEDIAAAAPVSLSQHITTSLDFLARGLDSTEVRTPPAAIDFARLLAEHGVPISQLLRIYRLVHADLLQHLNAETARVAGSQELINEMTVTLSALAFEYVDRTSEQTVAAYQRERDRWLQRRLLTINEAGTRIGTTLDTTRTAQELADVGADHLADLVTVDLLSCALQEDETHPAAGSLTLHRVARAVSDTWTDPTVDPGRTHTHPEGSEPARVLATGQPVRLRIAADDVPTWLAMSTDRGLAEHAPGPRSMLLVPLWARGSPLGLAQFVRSHTAEPFDDDELLLAREIASRAAVNIDNARRYTQERATALTLQRSLLPQDVPEESAVETASRYLPSGSRAGVGGDWFDVIPLSGARVALVVGDVIGHGLHAAATMGRLRTAVRTLADIDLTPDELLTHLDDVVIRLQREKERGADEISATCLYAVYDPVSGTCALASAGHIPPAVVTPLTGDGDAPASRAVDFPEMPIGPPLGLGGLPFETAQFEMPPDGRLVLYTDGLVQNRSRDVDTALDLLRDVLTRAPASLEETCDELLAALLPQRPADDVALLVARTEALDAEHVATWDVPCDPAVVSEVRAHASAQLAAWGLEELGFTTELVVSELVTNAIRYGRSPILLRMILQSTLTCEVSDTSSTAPHLRRARACDEGGRGLLLVAQLTEHWGTRHNPEGKVIWAEQKIPPSLAEVPSGSG